jgi:uncharacterized membrane protein YfcA
LPELNLIEVGLYLLTGAFAGFAAGLFGVGGGLIIVPVLYHAFSTQGYDQQHLMHMAIATSLATIVITSISSSLAHQKKRAVLWPVFILLTPGIIFGSWSGGIFASSLRNSELTSIFAVFEFIVALHLLLKRQPPQHASAIGKLPAGIGGFIIGFISAIVGIGGGTMTVPFLHWFNVSMRNAVATSAACGFPIALFGTLSYVYTGWDRELGGAAVIGYLNLQALFFIALTSFIFATLGAKVAHSISETKLRLSFALLLFVLGATMFLS